MRTYTVTTYRNRAIHKNICTVKTFYSVDYESAEACKEAAIIKYNMTEGCAGYYNRVKLTETVAVNEVYDFDPKYVRTREKVIKSKNVTL
jgi:hypothetical protein